MASPSKQRSYNMSRILSRDNETTEKRLARLFRSASIKGWRRHLPLVGKPDFAFPKKKVAIFVDGCFWHGCTQCPDGHKPKTNRSYWSPKIQGNRLRDRRQTRQLKNLGWQVVRIWEHQLSGYIKPSVLAKFSALTAN